MYSLIDWFGTSLRFRFFCDVQNFLCNWKKLILLFREHFLGIDKYCFSSLSKNERICSFGFSLVISASWVNSLNQLFCAHPLPFVPPMLNSHFHETLECFMASKTFDLCIDWIRNLMTQEASNLLGPSALEFLRTLLKNIKNKAAFLTKNLKTSVFKVLFQCMRWNCYCFKIQRKQVTGKFVWRQGFIIHLDLSLVEVWKTLHFVSSAVPRKHLNKQTGNQIGSNQRWWSLVLSSIPHE